MNDASLIGTDDQPAIRLERQLTDPPEVVWGALTERERLRDWFPCDVIVAGGEWLPGAAIEFPFPPDLIDLTLTGEVLEVEHPHRLVFTWGEEVLRFELTPRDGGTHLVLIDQLPPAAAARNAAGWDACLDRLAGSEPPEGHWRERFTIYTTAFEPSLGPQEGPPSGYKGNKAKATS